jgi:hypothetical protein
MPAELDLSPTGRRRMIVRELYRAFDDTGTIGCMDRCWCGDLPFHDWPGKADGAPSETVIYH